MDDKYRLVDFLTNSEYEADELDYVQNFHESTKQWPATSYNASRRIVEYLTDRRAIIETRQNYKEYFSSEAIKLEILTPRKPLSDVLNIRKSTRNFSEELLSLTELSGCLSGLPVNRSKRVNSEPDVELSFRPYPSAGGLFPVEVYTILLNVQDLSPSICHYNFRNHQLEIISTQVEKADVLNAMGNPDGYILSSAAVICVFTAVIERSVVKYKQMGYRFCVLEAGIVSHTVELASNAAGIGTLHWGGYLDDMLADLLKIDNVNEVILHSLILGKENPNDK